MTYSNGTSILKSVKIVSKQLHTNKRVINRVNVVKFIQQPCNIFNVNRKADLQKTIVSLCSSIKFNNRVNCEPSSYEQHLANLSTSVLLDQDEKALCRYHLLLVSVALLVICVLVSLCGTFSSRSPHSFQGNVLQKVGLWIWTRAYQRAL